MENEKLMKELKQLIKETFEMIEKPEAELRRIISAMDPDEIANFDYVDEDTGEVFLQKGEKASQSYLHPAHKSEEQKPKFQYDDADLDDAEEDGNLQKISQDAFDAAVKEFA